MARNHCKLVNHFESSFFVHIIHILGDPPVFSIPLFAVDIFMGAAGKIITCMDLTLSTKLFIFYFY